LQIRSLPVFAGENFPAVRGTAVALHRIIIVIGHHPIVGELFAGVDIAHGYERNLAAHAKIRIARVI